MAIELTNGGHVLRCDDCDGAAPVFFPTAGSAWEHAKALWVALKDGTTLHRDCFQEGLYQAMQDAQDEDKGKLG